MKRIELIYPKLSYAIVGILFDVYNTLGPGYHEKNYQNAIKEELIRNKISFQEQVYIPIKFKGDKIGNYYLDFLIDNRIILELKRGERYYKKDFNQVYAYLQATDLKLGILAIFASKNLYFKRILNINQ
ncbi:GxxExxY protein [Patescibacteria group bacterium]|nr:GxxExxY protein [Patescibacteria group bacterium]